MRVGYEALAWGRQIHDHRDAWEVVRRADHVFSNSQYTRTCVTALGGAEERLSLLHPGVTTEYLEAPSRTREELKREQGLSDRRVILTVAPVGSSLPFVKALYSTERLWISTVILPNPEFFSGMRR